MRCAFATPSSARCTSATGTLSARLPLTTHRRRMSRHAAAIFCSGRHRMCPLGVSSSRSRRLRSPISRRRSPTSIAIHLSSPLSISAATGTVLVVPMLKGDELVGAIAITRQEVRLFTDKQIDLLSNFAKQAVIAIENTRLLNELRQRTDDLSEALEQQTATSEVLRVISGSPGELAPVFEAMLANATRLCEASFGTLALYEGEAFRL